MNVIVCQITTKWTVWSSAWSGWQYEKHLSSDQLIPDTKGREKNVLDAMTSSCYLQKKTASWFCSKVNHIGSDNGLSPSRRQAIIWTNAGILLIRPLRTNFNETLIAIHTFSFKKMHLKMSSANRRPFCLGLNVLSHTDRSVWSL